VRYFYNNERCSFKQHVEVARCPPVATQLLGTTFRTTPLSVQREQFSVFANRFFYRVFGRFSA
jgi:hypothetical protein